MSQRVSESASQRVSESANQRMIELERRLRPAAYMVASSAVPYPPVGRGLAYVLAGNGVFKVARNDWMMAWVQLAGCRVAGLPEVQPGIALRFRVPGEILEHILEDARLATVNVDGTVARLSEAMYFVHRDEDGTFWVERPEQVAGRGRVHYAANGAGSVVMEVHSHHEMPAYFSGVDDADETGFRLYGVLGEIYTAPEMALRVGMYGDFMPVGLEEVFDPPWPVRDGY